MKPADKLAKLLSQLRCQIRPPALIQDLIAYLNRNSDDKEDSTRKTHSPEHKEHQSFFPRKEFSGQTSQALLSGEHESLNMLFRSAF
ncbi:hypothetical protein CDAR_384491 [Caerostris darwini]|uniref:Uncharacterized protein n=1 Tax=Caerostris darwini TaxID=1538125 RepID=A0AAV4TKN8_9ARAC|nr:hypothetical protein CDAR_384471 [Caerostris darwini]GIY46058.1 hypothetical protein CDAR_384491 [Caerostris darwini]